MNLDLIREDIKKNLGRKIVLKIYGMRNKNYSYAGTLYQVYPNIFTVIINGAEKSFSYSDVITKEIVITYL